MVQAPLPDNEAVRVKALCQLNILDTAPEPAFDDLARLAAYICQTPVALVSLVDSDRLWFKSKVGLDTSEIPRDATFCAQAILQTGPLVVNDVQQDEQFVHIPLAQADPAVRFYAGMPLVTGEGYGLGTLCVLDYVPRQLDSAQLEALQALARQVMAQLELRRSLAELTETQTHSSDILESITDAFLALDDEWRFTYINRQAEVLLRRSRTELLGRCIWEEFSDLVDSAIYRKYQQAVETQTSVEFEEFYPSLETWFSIHAYPSRQGLSVYFEDINARKQAEAALRSSEERYRLLFENNPQPMWVYDLETLAFLAVNRAAIAHYGYSQEEFLSMTLCDIRPPEDIPVLLQNVANLTSGIGQVGLWQHCKKDGSLIDVEITVHDLIFAGKQSVMVLVNDVTDRRRAERSLLETTLLQQAILDGANYTIISTDLDGTIRTFNRAAEQLLGYSADEVVGKTPLLIHDLKEVEQRARELSEELGETIAPGFECFVHKIRSGGVEEREWTYIRKDGSRFPIVLSATGLRDSDGNLTGFLGIGSDISDRKQAAEMLQLQSMRSQLFAEISLKIRRSLQLGEILQTAVTEVQKIFQSDRVLIFRLDSESKGQVIQEAVAPGWSSTLDLKVQDDCFGADYLRKYRQGRVYTVNDVGTAKLEPCLVHFLEYLDVKSKLVMPILLKDQFWGLLIVHQCDRPRQWTSSEIELTQQLADQIGIALAQSQMLEQANLQSQELARSNADLEQFAYVASHDLQEPLRMVASYLQLLERRYRGQLDDTADEFINYAVDGAMRMQTLINDLLDYSRVDSRGKSFVLTPCSAILDRAIANLQTTIKVAHANVTCDPLPEIMADATQLTQLFQNLISNAIKFCSNQRPQIHISSQRRADAWLFSVQDNGIGIDSEYVDRIFLIFQRLHSRGEYPGTGIGLAICKKIIERHGGSIWVESQPGQGSTFYFTIPDRGGNSA
ncbi:PAS domain S-box protein [Leptolyngbya sp. FACHB-541]|uniref:PAS domain S-box protein n=1 Tax=Leptolyngbya sp. FACHB-541 TaxID=2692810 RepID=UPI0016877C0D|nr:PAS domain S-box protein [Leptolyngbya sp. FACHB-541]MBD1995446.1 PAS domain S-box protein [Leptolyngbya sp. FACHB-541]